MTMVRIFQSLFLIKASKRRTSLESKRDKPEHRCDCTQLMLYCSLNICFFLLFFCRTKTRWGIKTLEACERSTSSRITLTFDTMKRDKRERVYQMDAHDCQLLENRLRDMLSQRPLSEMNQRLYKCVVCNAKFSREVNTKRLFDGMLSM